MNAIVGLCHFCEAHGPRPLFCTFTTDDKSHTTESSKSSFQCCGCASIGPETVFVSEDQDGTIFCSREAVPNPEVTAFMRQAAIRSITCEVSWSKEGGIVYFSDTRGHVLSLMFQLKDTRARGLKRWFSIVVLMKDKMMLLNITPLLSEHMQTIAKELQDLAEVVYNEEQSICSQRALRLKTGRNDFGQSRSLIQLTGNEDVFKMLHSHFTWMLKAGALNFTETLYTSKDLLDKLKPNSTKSSVFDPNICTESNDDDCVSLRELENIVSKPVFKILMYCTLMGINIVLKSQQKDPSIIIKGLGRLLPCDSYMSHQITCMNSEEPVTASAGLCVLEETQNNNFACNWPGVLPAKCPTVMNRIESAINNSMFNDAVLHQHVKSLIIEWLGIAKAVKSATDSSSAKSDSVKYLKQSFGLTQQDDQLIHHWISTFCK